MIVFLHGVPESSAIWDELRDGLDEPSIALALPGFGCPRPEGFGATKDDYVDWVVAELAKIDGPIDLVGHDWGAGLTYRVATAHGHTIRSWAADIANAFHPDYVWHDFAKIWQTPGDGEQFFVDQLALPVTTLAELYGGLGLPPGAATAMAAALDEAMASCILDLYRSALPNPYADWKDAFGPTSAPGLVLCAADDPFSELSKSVEVAAMLGARHEVIGGVGHFWPAAAPAVGARALRAFHASVR